MQYSRREQERFLDEELSAIAKNYADLIKKPAIKLMEEGEVFVSLFNKIDAQGCAILTMRNSRGLPRKGDFFCATLLIGDMSSYKNWGQLSWADLRRQYQKEFSEVYCVWLGKSNDPEFSLVGIKGMSLELANELIPECVLVLGPQDPPTAYYENLIDILRDEPADTPVGEMLDSEHLKVEWNPVRLTGAQSTGEFFKSQLSLSDEIIIQGPPGTGKTHKMASLISQLPKESSVLVTALTNRALMELAEKDSLADMLKEGKVHKTSLTVDEQRELPALQPIEGKNPHCVPGNLTLASFYAASRWAKMSDGRQLFDYVIMDEASQAFYVMVCAAKKLGKKVIWIGDQCQMPPVINMNKDRVNERRWAPLASGFKTLCENFPYPSYILSESYRLSERACNYTSLFYGSGVLHSIAKDVSPIPLKELNASGGPSLIRLDLKAGERSPQNMIDMALDLVKRILAHDKRMEIAVLSKFRSTVKNIQREFIKQYGEQNKVLIDTVERVQGLTCNVCIFCIPNDLQYMSLEKTFFNVATSRSINNTVIICDNKLLSTVTMDEEVRKYLERLW